MRDLVLTTEISFSTNLCKPATLYIPHSHKTRIIFDTFVPYNISKIQIFFDCGDSYKKSMALLHSFQRLSTFLLSEFQIPTLYLIAYNMTDMHSLCQSSNLQIFSQF